MISNRLKSLTKYIDKSDIVIDIGCDHALLDVYLVKNNYIDKMIVSDIHQNALDAGIENIKKYQLSKKIDARLGNGLEVLNENDKIDTVLISGMGSTTIIKILENEYISKINKLIIQSNNDHDYLREQIIKKGFYIDAEEYLIDNKKNYINIIFKRGKKTYNNIEIKYGPFLMKNKEYLEFELNKIDKIYKLIPKMKLKYRIQLKKEKIKLQNLLNKVR